MQARAKFTFPNSSFKSRIASFRLPIFVINGKFYLAEIYPDSNTTKHLSLILVRKLLSIYVSPLTEKKLKKNDTNNATDVETEPTV